VKIIFSLFIIIREEKIQKLHSSEILPYRERIYLIKKTKNLSVNNFTYKKNVQCYNLSQVKIK